MLSVCTLKHLTSETVILKRPDTETDLRSVVSLIEPPVCKIELQHLRVIQEAVIVHIVRFYVS